MAFELQKATSGPYRFRHKGLLYQISSDEDGIGITCLAKPEEVGLRDPYSMEREAAAAEVLNLVEEIAELKANPETTGKKPPAIEAAKKESPMAEHVYVFTHEGVRWSLGDDGCLASDQGHHFYLFGTESLAAEVFRLAAENRRLLRAENRRLMDVLTPAPAHPRAYALAEAALVLARVLAAESVPYATAACVRLLWGEDRPPRHQVLAMLYAMEAGAEQRAPAAREKAAVPFAGPEPKP